jgi:hypothetical protein
LTALYVTDGAFPTPTAIGYNTDMDDAGATGRMTGVRPAVAYAGVVAFAVGAVILVSLSVAVAFIPTATVAHAFGFLLFGLALGIFVLAIVARMGRGHHLFRTVPVRATSFRRNNWPIVERGFYVAFCTLMVVAVWCLAVDASDRTIALAGSLVAGGGAVAGAVAAYRAWRSDARIVLSTEGVQWVDMNGRDHLIPAEVIGSSRFELLRNGMLHIEVGAPGSSSTEGKRLCLLDFGPDLPTLASALEDHLVQHGGQLVRVNRFR